MISQPLYEVTKIQEDGTAVLMVNTWFSSPDVASRYLSLEQALGNLESCQVTEAASRAYIVTERAAKTDFGNLGVN